MVDLVEDVARAWLEVNGVSFDDYPPRSREMALKGARAAISATLLALREPTPEMVQSRIDRYPSELRIHENDLEVWRDMIDTAIQSLKETP